ncbi:hypothetical protein MMC20_001425 [Loxospora ochrophaea]|nr:hypothetical protein [Loxospora ochrophaea]
METYVLPATTYEPPRPQAGRHVLNTIIEDEFSDNDEESRGGSRGRSRSPTASRSVESGSPVPSLTSSVSSYYRSRRRSRDFDDLYDVSDCESDRDKDATPPAHDRPISMCTESTKRDSISSNGSRNQYPSLVIPSPRHWPTISKFQKNSPVPPTPPAKIPISPAVLSLLGRDVPASSAPPSLDGSLTSDQINCFTAPATPDMQIPTITEERWDEAVMESRSFSGQDANRSIIPEVQIRLDDSRSWDDEEAFHTQAIEHGVDFPGDSGIRPESPILGLEEDSTEVDLGVQLPPDAMDTLRQLTRVSSVGQLSSVDSQSAKEMQEISSPPSRPQSVDMTPASETSGYSISQMSIPSPGAFFSSLGGNARHTWCVFGSEPASAAPPSSATAEHFYSAPWNVNSGTTVERFIEVEDDGTDGPPTARQLPVKDNVTDYFSQVTKVEDTNIQETKFEKEAKDFDEDYEKEILEAARSSLDRTTVWLAAQTSYMSILRETNPINKPGSTTTHRSSRHVREDSLDSPMKKAVRFLDSDIAKESYSEGLKPKDSKKANPLFYQAFQHISNATCEKDTFVHRQIRFDAVQASRVSLPQEHVDQLTGNFYTKTADRPNPLRPISMMPGKESSDGEETAEQRVIARVEKERQALEQVNSVMWIVEASKYLGGGRLLNSPVINVLSAAPPLQTTKSSTHPDRVRVLDLAGQPKCDWAWHCACEYPNAKIYTATSTLESDSHSPLRGPSNHRLLSVSKLWELPFPDSHFDAISTRSLFAALKCEKPLGESFDQYDMCLRECLRVLKPGGYLEFFLQDSEILHAGPRGTAASVEFAFNLRSRGYDPAPTKNWLGRVRRAGFVDIKRAWVFLPMGAPQPLAPCGGGENLLEPTPRPNASLYESRLEDAEAVRGPVGSTADAANVAGLVGAWAWEQWMVKVHREMGKGKLLEGVEAVVEEGRGIGAGWRCLSGWARKGM